MSRESALGRVKLEHADGREVKDAFLPLDVDLWNQDHTRYTVFFDPGRVKRGIRPNVELGRALEAGRSYAIVIDRAWRDAAGQPLGATYRYEFRAAAAEERALDVTAWRVAAPPPHTRAPLTVTFPWPLDRALLERAVGVRTRTGVPVAGDATVGHGERTWSFTPHDPWRAGPHALIVLAVIEDPAGNRIGHPFEMANLSRPRANETESVAVEFSIGK